MSSEASGPSRHAAAAAAVFAALGDPTRLALVSRLGDGRRRSIAQLTRDHALTRQAISKHLRVLEAAHLVRRRHAGREMLYTLDPAALDRARDYMQRVSQQWDAALERLRAHVEG